MTSLRQWIRETIIKELAAGQNPFDEPTAPVKEVPGKAPIAPPVKAPVQKLPVPKAPLPKPKQNVPPPAPAPQKGQPLGKIQYEIFNIKLRVNRLALKTKLNKFLMSLRDFNNKVTKNTEDNVQIQTYLAPLKGDLQSLKGALESLETELNKLDSMTQVEEK